MQKLICALALVAAVSVTSCRKKSDVTAPGSDTTAVAPSKLDLLKDSVYLYSKEVYLWSDLIPPYAQFNPRQYSGTSELASATAVMNGIRALQPLDRFSMVTSNAVAEGIQTGEDTDLGFTVKPAALDRALPIDSVYWFVTYVYTNSPAGKAGVQRGMILSKINNSNVEYTDASINLLNNVIYGSTASASFQFIKPDKSLLGPVTLTKASYVANSVLHRSVLTSGSKKVGYLVFNQFFGQPSRRELGEAFTFFQGQAINDLVLDLRYNPGGSTETQDTLANLIAPPSANGQTMYQYIFNETLQQNKHQLIRKKLGYGNSFTAAANTVLFKKAGNLSLPRVFIIVSGSSVSASELLINNLKPYMNVQLIGDTTYGKPVGFFPISIFDYSIFPVSFKTVNKAGNSDYYNGFAPDALAGDNVTYNWGDPNESSLAAALKYITTGGYRTAASNEAEEFRFRTDQLLQPAVKKLEEKRFTGMFK